MGGKKLEDQLATWFAGAGLKFEREPVIGGLQPDFVVWGPHGKKVVVEAKAWDPRGGNTARALEQVEYYRDLTGADHAFFVLPKIKRNLASRGVVGADAIMASLKGLLGVGKGPLLPKPKQSQRSTSPGKTVFAAMPFMREYDDTYFVAMTHAAESVGAACARVDRTEFSGDIVEEIKRLIKNSIAVIVDLSESKPNVLYEAGYAHALAKPVVHVCSSPLEDLPFDVRNWNTIPYSRGQTAKLRDPLTKRLRAAIDGK